MSDPGTPLYPAYLAMASAKVNLIESPIPAIRELLLAPGNVRLELYVNTSKSAPAGVSFEHSPVRTVAKRCRAGCIDYVGNPVVWGIESIAGRNVVPYQRAVTENHHHKRQHRALPVLEY